MFRLTAMHRRSRSWTCALFVTLFASTAAWSQLPPPCQYQAAPQGATRQQVRELFSDTPMLEIGTEGQNPTADLADERDSVWASSAGVGRLHSAAYPGKAGTLAANSYLYLYDVTSLGGKDLSQPGHRWRDSELSSEMSVSAPESSPLLLRPHHTGGI